MESAKAKVSIEYDIVSLTKESKDTVLKMMINILRPLEYWDQRDIINGLCDEYGVREFDPYDD